MATMNMYRYRYSPANVVLTMDEETYEFVDGAFTYCNIIHDYTGTITGKPRRLPLIQCAMEMELKHIAILYQHLEDARMKLDIIERRYDTEGRLLETRPYIQKTFSIVPARAQSVYITSTDIETANLVDDMHTLQLFDFYLVDLDLVTMFTKERGGIYKKITYSALLQSAFVQREIPGKDIIASPPSRDGEIDGDVMVPWDTLIGNLHHINSTYGIYDNTPIIYHDLDKLYCISKTDPNIVLPDAQDYGTITFVLQNPDNAEHNVQGSYDDSANEVHWVNISTEPMVEDTTMFDTSSKAATVASVDSSGDVEKTTVDSDATTVKYIYSKNDLSRDQVINDLLTGHHVVVSAPDSSVMFLKPYKDCTFEVDTSYTNLDLANHIYRILGWELTIHREGSTDYLNEVSIIVYNPIREGLENDEGELQDE